ncbi:MAG: hypothetical protein L6266_02140, partial [Nanoarchaeota archaeon]|nr:hypothetical protein [Nanoarchaeota archaeon]
MIEIARNIGDNGNIITATFDYLNKDLMEKHKERLVEISTIAEKYTEEIYWFMDLTGAIPDDESILKFKTSMEQDQELTYEELKKIYTRIGDENLIGALEFFKGTPAYSEKRSVRLVDHIHDLKNALVLHYAKENGLDIKSLNTLKIKLFSEYFIDNAELYNQMPYVQNERVNGIIGERPSLKEYKTYLELNKNIAQAMVNAYNNEKEMGEEVKKEVFDLINSTTRTLAGVVNTLHNNTHLREKAASELTPEIIYFTIAQGDEIFTSSFNLLYDNLAYKLNNGKGILTQAIERRTQVQQRIVDEGKCKILDYIGNIDREEKRLTRFLMTSSLYGRLDEIMPKEKIEQEKFLNKIVSYVIGVNDAFYLAPTFETIFTKDTKYKETLENILIKNYEKDKNITYGLILLSNQQKISETNKIKVNDIVAELNKEYGIKENDLEIPQEWYAKENPDDSLEFKFKLYFHPETDNDDPKITTHSRIMTDYFTKRGYSQHINKKSERILTKTKINKYGEKIKLKFILSNKENIKLKEDTKDAKTILIGHGGHSYDVEKTFDDYVGDDNINTKLAFLRSCGGFNQIPYINRLFEGKVQVIGTKNMGQGIVNNAILYELAEALTDKPKMWKEIYKQIEKNIQKNHPKFIECFKTYSFPGDLPSLILKYSKEQDDNYYD